MQAVLVMQGAQGCPRGQAQPTLTHGERLVFELKGTKRFELIGNEAPHWTRLDLFLEAMC